MSAGADAGASENTSCQLRAGAWNTKGAEGAEDARGVGGAENVKGA